MCVCCVHGQTGVGVLWVPLMIWQTTKGAFPSLDCCGVPEGSTDSGTADGYIININNFLYSLKCLSVVFSPQSVQVKTADVNNFEEHLENGLRDLKKKKDYWST